MRELTRESFPTLGRNKVEALERWPQREIWICRERHRHSVISGKENHHVEKTKTSVPAESGVDCLDARSNHVGISARAQIAPAKSSSNDQHH